MKMQAQDYDIESVDRKPLDQFLRPGTVQYLTGLSHSTLWRLSRAGKFPRPVKIGIRCVGYRRSEVESWIQSRMAARDNATLAPEAA
jgi:prophage regulatory protein